MSVKVGSRWESKRGNRTVRVESVSAGFVLGIRVVNLETRRNFWISADGLCRNYRMLDAAADQ